MLGAAPRSVGIGNGRRTGVALPGAVVARNRPEIAGLGAAAAGIEHRRAGLVDKQPGRAEQDLAQPPPQRHQLGGGIADPERQHRAVDLDPLRQQDLGLSVKRQMPGVFADQHMRDHRLGRQASADQALRRRSLDDGAGARAAAVFRAAGDENAVLRRDDVEPFGSLLADHMHRPAATGARCCFRFDDDLDPRQVRGQRFACAGLAPRARLRLALLRCRLAWARAISPSSSASGSWSGSSRSECRPNCTRCNCRMIRCIRSMRRSSSSRSAISASAAARRPGMSSGSASAVVIAIRIRP